MDELDVRQSVGDVGGDFTKTIVVGDDIDFSEDGAEMGCLLYTSPSPRDRG